MSDVLFWILLVVSAVSGVIALVRSVSNLAKGFEVSGSLGALATLAAGGAAVVAAIYAIEPAQKSLDQLIRQNANAALDRVDKQIAELQEEISFAAGHGPIGQSYEAAANALRRREYSNGEYLQLSTDIEMLRESIRKFRFRKPTEGTVWNLLEAIDFVALPSLVEALKTAEYADRFAKELDEGAKPDDPRVKPAIQSREDARRALFEAMNIYNRDRGLWIAAVGRRLVSLFKRRDELSAQVIGEVDDAR
ncbi:hypothetical protein [Chenggangzhangella methanolivorans]|uniref:Uncharacterized protein n=1 Tax=Chenggangzhangella methanolivorans TaxID=1437009 RepID=A0A9E6REN4_9HYPH|nr:hypothetical protein [Chenggangzhangella methanolivorans]QZN99526.1 hypothetical protein K6K41_22910 [Chenggangzhangella methanolivorans]